MAAKTLSDAGNLAFVTVMDIDVYTPIIQETWTPGDYLYEKEDESIKCLTISNITQEGPRKEIRGGRNAEPCVRYGKTMRLEMEDAVMRKDLLVKLFGAKIEDAGTATEKISFTEKFPTSMMLVGRTKLIDQASGDAVEVQLVLYRFLPDGVTDLTMESEGDIGVISIAGELFSNSSNEFFTIEDKEATFTIPEYV